MLPVGIPTAEWLRSSWECLVGRTPGSAPPAASSCKYRAGSEKASANEPAFRRARLSQQVTLRDLAKRRQLRRLPRAIAPQLARHQLHHAGGPAEGGLGVQEQRPRAPRQDILQGEGQFVT